MDPSSTGDSFLGLPLSVDNLLPVVYWLAALHSVLLVVRIAIAIKVYQSVANRVPVENNAPKTGQAPSDQTEANNDVYGVEQTAPARPEIRTSELESRTMDQHRVRFRDTRNEEIHAHSAYRPAGSEPFTPLRPSVSPLMTSTPANPVPSQPASTLTPPSPPHQWLVPPTPPSSQPRYATSSTAPPATYPSPGDTISQPPGPSIEDSRTSVPYPSLRTGNMSYEDTDLNLSRSRQEKPLDTFTGTQAELKDWLHHFDIVAELNAWSEAEKGAHLASSLRGRALQVLDELLPGERKDYRSVVGALKRRFDPDQRECLKKIEFRNRTMRKGETVTDYGYSLSRLAKGAFPKHDYAARDDVVIEQFITGLYCDEIKRHVQYGRPKSLEEAIASAIEYESVEGRSKGRKPEERSVRTVAKEKKEESEMAGFFREIMKGFNSLSEYIKNVKPFNSHNQPRRNRNCYRCGSPSHWASDCTQPQDGAQLPQQRSPNYRGRNYHSGPYQSNQGPPQGHGENFRGNQSNHYPQAEGSNAYGYQGPDSPPVQTPPQASGN